MSDVIEGEVLDEETETGHEVVHVPHAQLPAEPSELSVDELVAQVEKVREIQRRVMREGVHYGNVPGVDKPSLSKAGAETLNLTFKMAPRYRVTKTYEGEHLTVDVVAELYHRLYGNFIGEGVGMCSTKEAKYAFRSANRVCPTCGKDAIIKGKEEYGGGWVCFKKKDGCGAKFADDSPDGIALANVQVGKVANDALPDTWNTVEKMAKKRALVDAVVTATAAGDVFTQDLDDADAPRAEEGKSETGPVPETASDRSAAPSSADGEAAKEPRINALVKLFEENGIDAAKTFAIQRAENDGVLRAGWVESAIAQLAPPLAKDAA